MVGEAPRDLRDRELRGRYDGAQARELAPLLRPAQPQRAGRLASLELDPGVLLQAEARRLQDRGNRRAHDVLPVLREIGVAVRGDAGKTIAAVPEEDDLEQGARPFREALSW